MLSNYRPITLLNTDYRVLARVLAARFGALLGEVVGPEQSAFLPGRHIGDNVLSLRLLPAALAAQRGQQPAGLPDAGAVVELQRAVCADSPQ